MTKCDCGCGFETGSPEFQDLHVDNNLDRLIHLGQLIAINGWHTNPENIEFNDLKTKIEGMMYPEPHGYKIKELQADIDTQNNVKEQNEYIIKELESNVRSNEILCDVYVKEINSLESQLKGEQLLSDKRRTDGIEMILEIVKLKEQLEERNQIIEAHNLLINQQENEIAKLKDENDDLMKLRMGNAKAFNQLTQEHGKLKEEVQTYIKEVGILRAERNESLSLLAEHNLFQSQLMHLLDDKIIVKSGDPVSITGYYKLVNHNPECFRTTMSNGMFFKKREEAPMTGACEHVAQWELISEYEGPK